MRLPTFILAAVATLGLSACVIEPVGFIPTTGGGPAVNSPTPATASLDSRLAGRTLSFSSEIVGESPFFTRYTLLSNGRMSSVVSQNGQEIVRTNDGFWSTSGDSLCIEPAPGEGRACGGARIVGNQQLFLTFDGNNSATVMNIS